MKILIFAAYFFPHTGGYEKYIYEISSRLANQGHDISIVTCNTENSPTEEILYGIKIYRLPSITLLNGNYPIPKINVKTYRLLRKLSRQNFDFIITNTRFFITSLYGMLFSKLRNIPLIHIEHGSAHPVQPTRLLELIAKLYDHTIGHLVVAAAKKNVCVSEKVEFFLKHLGAKETIVIYNGVDTKKFSNNGNKINDIIVLDPVTTISFIGRLIYAKGIHDLITIFKEIKKDKKLKLLIVGDGQYQNKLEKIAEKDSDVVFMGTKSSDEIVNILNNTDIFVNPSYSEGLPTSILEAGSVGIAIIATKVGGTDEIIENQKNGILIEPGDTQALKSSLEMLIDDVNLRIKIGTNVQKTVVEKFDWDIIMEKYIKLFGELN
jgi:glycosyltransferase involved in cell wall biosynthesis